MARRRADWDNNLAKVFLDLCIAEKEKLNYSCKGGLTKLGWQNLYQNFLQQTGTNFDKKQLQNKFNSFKRLYRTWRKLQTASGVGWDNRTGTIAMDDEWWDRQIAEDHLAESFRRKPIPYQDELDILFGSSVSEDNIGRSSVGQATHRSRKEQVVDSPPLKRNKSVEYYIERLSESMLERSRTECSAMSREQDEIKELLGVVVEDGVNKSDELYFIATELFRTPARRTAFRSFDTSQDRIAWLRWTWDNVEKK